MSSSNGHNKEHDEFARQWIASLRQGVQLSLPSYSVCPIPYLAQLSRVYRESGNNLAALEATISSMAQSPNTYPHFADLLKPYKEPVETDDTLFIPALPALVMLSSILGEDASVTMDMYIKFSKLMSPEGFEDFHEACFLSMLSTIAGRRVAIPFAERQYTPLMIALVARTSLYKKTTTTKVVKTVLRACGLDWLLGADETTPQKLLTDMAGAVPVNYPDFDNDKQDRVKRRLGMSGQRGWSYDEFGSLIKSMLKRDGYMQEFKKLLLTLDSCEETYTYSTQRRGDETVEKPYLSLLGTMTPSCIKDAGKAADFWSDGFWARFAFVCPPPDTSIDSPMSLGIATPPIAILKKLIEMHERLGEPYTEIEEVKDKKGQPTGKFNVQRGTLPEQECTFGEGVYDAWIAYRSALKQIVKLFKHEDFDGWYDRLPIKAIRIAALLAILENNGVIEMNHWAKAQEIAERWRVSLHHLYAQSHAQPERESRAAQLEEQIIKRIKQLTTEKEQPPTVRDVKCYFKKISTPDIQDMMKKMTAAGVLVEIRGKKASRYAISEEGEESVSDVPVVLEAAVQADF